MKSYISKKSAIFLCLVFSIPIFFSLSAHAENISLSSPAACRLGEECWIVNYIDTNPQDQMQNDYMCASRSYDSHTGTDFGLKDQLSMEQGVEVLAAADGKVLRVRDGIIDKIVTEEERAALLEKNTGCGNGVVIEHKNGWQTLYCHMKQNSIIVKNGQRIKRGEKIGLIGNSGIAEFPHLHFGVIFEGSLIDPFTATPLSTPSACPKKAHSEKTLWADEPAYEPVIIYASGFKNSVPDFDAVKIDATPSKTISKEEKILTYWAGMFGVEKNDNITLKIITPEGKILAQRVITQEKTRARQFYYIGKKFEENIPAGIYKAEITLSRTNAEGELINRARFDEILVQ